jgi:catechol 2,3-dioxygenase-like lactoylglutathione lyase family enzyme
MRWAAVGMICAVFGVLFAHQEQSKMPIIESKLVNVVVETTNLSAEVEFYENTLGFKSFFRNKTSCFLKAGGVNLVFVVAQRKSQTTKNLCLDVAVTDLSAALSALTAAGIKVDNSDPAILKFNDPDGHLVEVVHG